MHLNRSNSIFSPTQAYNAQGEKVWECELDIYGKVRTIVGERSFIPFRYQGQYEDEETGLYYNRFRYYDSDTGLYISQDPIGLAGNNPNFYAYVWDANSWVDPLGLDVYGLYTIFDGWYPVYTRGSAEPTSYQFMKEGELYKIGESQRSSKRYSSTRLDEARINRSKATSFAVDADGKIIPGKTAGLDMKIIDSRDTKQADRLLETQKIKDYQNQNNGNLPAGNKTYH